MRYFLILFLIVSIACSENGGIVVNQGGNKQSSASFAQSSAFLLETDQFIDIDIVLSRPVSSNGQITIEITEISASYDVDYRTVPEPVNEQITLILNQGDTDVSFRVQALQDLDFDTETLNFEIISIDGEKLSLGNILSLELNIGDQNTVDPQYQACLTPLNSNVLDIVTWNIEQFPKQGNNTINLVEEILENMDADIIAIQEITDISDFNTLVNQLEGYSGKVYNLSGGLDMGYIYKNSEITFFSDLSIIFESDQSAFPREPVIATAHHTNGLEVVLFNLHLKCCNDGEQRREDASILLKDYLDQNYPNDAVIVLGDFNDDLNSGSPFSNFLGDTDNYTFADLDIAFGPSSAWSFPGFPSHIDHILVSNELEDKIISTQTIQLDPCVSNFDPQVSDHRPVMTSIGN